MTETQERALLPLISLLKAHNVDLVTIDEVLGLWASSCHGIRWTIPDPKKNIAHRKIYRRNRSKSGLYG